MRSTRKTLRKLIRAYEVSCRILLVFFFVGITIGFFDSVRRSVIRMNIVSVDELYHEIKSCEQQNISMTDVLSRAIRLHCVLLIKNSTKEKKSIKDSLVWASRCNSFSLYNITKTMPHWWEVFCNTFTNHWKKADWFVFVEPHTYFVPENIRLFLLPFFNSRDEPVAFGSQTKHGVLPFIILSIESMRWITDLESENTTICKHFDWNLLNDQCLSDVGIEVMETRDQYGRHRILPYSPETLLDKAKAKTLNVGKMRHPIRGGPMCCSSTAFAVMNINEVMRKTAHYFVSIVHTSVAEIDYTRMSFRQKLEVALEKAKEGIPPTIMWQ
ncbi:hypothetical protein GCK32_005298 [Trichostrongylus colubriformis]|uniref:Uncharacterized protein n=1 Tax=Trichostrongylus colubriformis TaxID=6319 RepID=A0AAN8EXF4_TRICO